MRNDFEAGGGRLRHPSRQRPVSLRNDVCALATKTVCSDSAELFTMPRMKAIVRGDIKLTCMGIMLPVRPGAGKSHVMAALGRALVEHGHPVLFISVATLVERLLDAKRNLRLARELKRLDNFDCLALDDIGYVQHDRAEMDVLFALLVFCPINSRHNNCSRTRYLCRGDTSMGRAKGKPMLEPPEQPQPQLLSIARSGWVPAALLQRARIVLAVPRESRIPQLPRDLRSPTQQWASGERVS